MKATVSCYGSSPYSRWLQTSLIHSLLMAQEQERQSKVVQLLLSFYLKVPYIMFCSPKLIACPSSYQWSREVHLAGGGWGVVCIYYTYVKSSKEIFVNNVQYNRVIL